MIDRTQQRALMAEVEFIAERMRLAALIRDQCTQDGRFELAGLMTMIEQVYAARIREIRFVVQLEADRLGIEIRPIEFEGRILRYEAWRNGQRIARSDQPGQVDINDMLETIYRNLGGRP